MKKRLVVLSGAGVSAESGLPTFRDNGGLWENHDVLEVASPAGWARDPALVLRFYNERRKRMWSCQPNAGHRGLVTLEADYRVTIITQNIDNLHERAGSTRVVHLHGELTKARSSRYPELVYEIGDRDIRIGDRCERGAQLRPHIVWFGEEVPLMARAAEIIELANIVVVVGTSLSVYPANLLVELVSAKARVFLVDPSPPPLQGEVTVIRATAAEGIPRLAKQLVTV